MQDVWQRKKKFDSCSAHGRSNRAGKNRRLLIHQYENNELTQEKLKLKLTLVKSHWCYVTKIHISVCLR